MDTTDVLDCREYNRRFDTYLGMEAELYIKNMVRYFEGVIHWR